jgi:hypothetical protein
MAENVTRHRNRPPTRLHCGKEKRAIYQAVTSIAALDTAFAGVLSVPGRKALWNRNVVCVYTNIVECIHVSVACRYL